MNLSKYLSRVIGVYFIIISVLILIQLNDMLRNLHDFYTTPGLVFISGIFTLILGIAFVVGHNIWEWSWRVILTILAWITLIKGTCLIAIPDNLSYLYAYIIDHPNIFYFSAIFYILLGGLLVYFGFKREE